jgi:hypothetical protein
MCILEMFSAVSTRNKIYVECKAPNTNMPSKQQECMVVCVVVLIAVGVAVYFYSQPQSTSYGKAEKHLTPLMPYASSGDYPSLMNRFSSSPGRASAIDSPGVGRRIGDNHDPRESSVRDARTSQLAGLSATPFGINLSTDFHDAWAAARRGR